MHLRNKYDKLRYDTLIFEDMKERITMRVGMGYDVHKLVEGRRLVLGGVEIPYEKGLLGHSDADVLVHAVMDALLGAAALAISENISRIQILHMKGRTV